MTPTSGVSSHPYFDGYEDSFRGRYNVSSHRRSRSAGRTPGRRDIVQDVYDRMGVGYARGVSSIDLIQRNANLEARGDSQSRGRSTHRNDVHDETETKQERARSLSRGRERLAARWSSAIENTPSADVSVPPSSNAPSAQVQKDRMLLGAQHDRGMSFVEAFTSSSFQSSFPGSTLQDEKKEEDPPPTSSEEEKKTPMRHPSIKDRISAYSGVVSSASAARTVRRSYNNQFSPSRYASKREPKPKVDIYDTANTNDWNESDIPLNTKTEKATLSPMKNSDAFAHSSSTADLTAYPGGSEKNQTSPGSSSSSPAGRTSRPGHVADAFLAAISPQKQQSVSPHGLKTFPILQIPSDEMPGAASPPSSAVSDEIMAPPASKQVVCGNPGKKSGSRHERLLVMAGNKIGNLTLEMIEKYIDQCIDEKTAELDHRFETHLRRMEERYLRHWNAWKASKN